MQLCDQCGKEIGLFGKSQYKGFVFCGEECLLRGTPKADKKETFISIGIAFGFLAGLFLLTVYVSGPSTPKSKAWNEGGTLHKATDSEWGAASQEDRLATASDYVASLRSFANESEMRRAAEQMERCITRAAASSTGQKSSALAAACNELFEIGPKAALSTLPAFERVICPSAS